MTHWIRFQDQDVDGFGTVEDGLISIHEGDMFEQPTDTGRTVALADVTVLMPTTPSKMIALWNNFHALAAKMDVTEPEDPLYLIKTSNSFLAHGQPIRRPKFYSGKVAYEGELAIVIGKQCADLADEAAADDCIFGYTVTNDVTAVELISKDKTFAQWCRSKSFDTFGIFGPVVATGLEASELTVKTVLNGAERQNYPLSDMIFQPRALVQRISCDMTLMPGDIICCGTSVGVGSMKEPSNIVEVTIDGIGTLSNTFDQ